ncbi:MAG: glutamine--fructose-6-phosphate transaminase (isomerizing) [Gammaproteobacteria bacterium]|nr:glutamine--fructose-6-phosphate transaminase (isomerizing) [Gammaproteobacteria bacterium]
MCGIVAAIAERDVMPILLEGLKRLEYRGYDSAGVAVLDEQACLARVRLPGKVAVLEQAVQQQGLRSKIGIAHTRWATHGLPVEKNAHPHICRDAVAMVHNGIIENHEQLRSEQKLSGHIFTSDTDSEVVVHRIHDQHQQGKDLLAAVQAAVINLEGAYAIAVISAREPQRIVLARRGTPLIIGLGLGENYAASDMAALLPVTRRFIILQEGDTASIERERIQIFDASGTAVERPVSESQLSADAVLRGEYRHFMLKEIYEQPQAIADTLEGRIAKGRLLEESLGISAGAILDATRRVDIVSCGTSYHAGQVARYWLEGLAGIACQVEVASEFRYRSSVVAPGSLLVLISQSGETADTLAVLRDAKRRGYQHTLAICNVAESSLVREADLVLMTRAGPEIGVASTKAFTTQLTALMLLVIALGRRGKLSDAMEQQLVSELESLPRRVEKILELDAIIAELSEQLVDKQHALFLGRGPHYPIAMEGALKLKEISYIHAEAYPAGELKHGPLALVDEQMPVIAVAPNNALLEKLKSNLHEVKARGGKLYVFADSAARWESADDLQVLAMESVEESISPIIFTIPLQLLAYHVAVLKGTDVDQPRNLAKSVTVE